MKRFLLYIIVLAAILTGCKTTTGVKINENNIIYGNDDIYILTKYKIRKGDKLLDILNKINLSSSLNRSIIKKFRSFQEPNCIQPGKTISLKRKLNGKFHSLEYDKSIDSTYLIINVNDSLIVLAMDQDIVTKDEYICGTIKENVYTTVINYKESPTLALYIEKIFLGRYNFYHDICEGDSFYIIIRKKYLNDKFVGYDRINYIKIKGEKINAEAIYYSNTEYCGYFDVSGNSLEKNLLITPVSYKKVTSVYGYRKHPITHKRSFHYGIDYAAPMKTPIYASADGVVIVKKYKRKGMGREIIIDHKNGYKTVYAHLYRFARGIKVGSNVKYGQLIGYLGNSGLSTGPHLHFGVLYKNQPVNPEKINISSLYIIKDNEFASFISQYGYLSTLAEKYSINNIKLTSAQNKTTIN